MRKRISGISDGNPFSKSFDSRKQKPQTTKAIEKKELKLRQALVKEKILKMLQKEPGRAKEIATLIESRLQGRQQQSPHSN